MTMDAAYWPQGIGVECSRNIAEKKPRPEAQEQGLNCPRCKSSNTKFCYYNNYSLSQPRYLCKSCRRYWTQGGSLRNVPVGGSSRKNKTRSSKTKFIIPEPDLCSPRQNPNMSYNHLLALPFAFQPENLNPQNPISSSSVTVKDIMISPPLISLPVSYPNSAFMLDGVQNRFGNLDPANSSRMIFPFEDQSNDHANGYWTGMLSGGSW